MFNFICPPVISAWRSKSMRLSIDGLKFLSNGADVSDMDAFRAWRHVQLGFHSMLRAERALALCSGIRGSVLLAPNNVVNVGMSKQTYLLWRIPSKACMDLTHESSSWWRDGRASESHVRDVGGARRQRWVRGTVGPYYTKQSNTGIYKAPISICLIKGAIIALVRAKHLAVPLQISRWMSKHSYPSMCNNRCVAKEERGPGKDVLHFTFDNI